MKTKIILLLSLFFCLSSSFITIPMEEEWDLVAEKNDLKVYKRTKLGSKFKEVKIVNIFNADMKSMLHELNDIDAYVYWVFKCSESYTVKRLSETAIVTYSLADMPMPIWDRDIVSYSKYEYNEKTGVHSFNSYTPENDEKYIPIKNRVVRVKDYKAYWTLEDLGNNRIKSVNMMHMEPGGSIPAWLNNMAITKGPTNSMKALQKRLDAKK
ncbi:MAG: hypothetical protein ACI94Y_004272 [Maribacter sp.]|jgi:hypothetical protein